MFTACAQLGVDHALRANLIVGNTGLTGDLGQGLKGRLRIAMVIQKPIKSADANASGAQEPEPVGPIFHSVGWGEGVVGRDELQ